MPPHVDLPFIAALDAAAPANARDDPNYYSRYPRSLITTSHLDSFAAGTAAAVYHALLPLLQRANHELLLVTCFWAPSPALDALNHLLRHLSARAIRRGTEKIRVRLCFSSRSLFQKLFHKQSLTGQSYPADVWSKTLGLPAPTELGGLDLKIKSVFLLPFSVMHPKFIIVDRQKVVLPSCNISWEEWFEGAATMTGPVVQHFLQFYFHFWERKSDIPTASWAAISTVENQPADGALPKTSLLAMSELNATSIPTIFLPSPHRRNPRLNPFSKTDRLLAPPTPLNTFLLTLFAQAEHSIRIQTPNVTAPPVLSALLSALRRGVHVHILTSERLMRVEQLVTAGTTTARCLSKLIKRYKKLYAKDLRQPLTDEEAAIAPSSRPGNLRISYFEPIHGPKPRGKENGEPQQSHFKMTMVDDEVVVLGSGNLDRASWFTSQELGLAFFDKNVVEKVIMTVDAAMQHRSRVVFDSERESV
ncbi:hypothetical protein ACEQ8H_008088 [Pleosporales sp. CAS-2024a]